jgi:hypothetical protein
VSNPNTGASKTTTTAAGAGPAGAAAGRQTTYTNPTTGKTETYGAATVNNNHYADVNGNVYKNTGDGWQKYDTGSASAPTPSSSEPRQPSTPTSTSQQPRSTGSWQSAGGDTSWADREQQTRSQGEDRFNSFSQTHPGGVGSTGESRFSGGGGGAWSDRLGGGASGAGRSGGGGGFRGRR